jgi:hypothetical protein
MACEDQESVVWEKDEPTLMYPGTADDPQLLLYGQLLQRISDHADAVRTLQQVLAAQAEALTRLHQDTEAQTAWVTQLEAALAQQQAALHTHPPPAGPGLSRLWERGAHSRHAAVGDQAAAIH